MWKNYFITALRNFRRNKWFSLINVAGLAIGLSASMVIFLIVRYEYSFDRFEEEGGQIYRVVSQIRFVDMTMKNSGTPFPLAEAVKQEASGLQWATAFVTVGTMKVETEREAASASRLFKAQDHIVFADPEFFHLIPYHWLAGAAATALNEPNRVVLSRSRAALYFPGQAPRDIVGNILIYGDTLPVKVAGVVDLPTGPTDFDFQELISYATITETGLKNELASKEWGSINSAWQLVIKLKPGISAAGFDAQLAAIRKKYAGGSDPKDDTRHFLQPLSDIHFNSDYDVYGGSIAHKPTLYGLMAVAVFLLLLGVINFVNLATAQAGKRAREIGIRKTMGGSKRQLILQFLAEAFVYTFFSMLFALSLIPWLLHIFHDFIPAGVSFSSIDPFVLSGFLFILLLGVSLLAGFYPALVITRFSPVAVLKNQAYSGTAQTRKAWLRKVLTVSQFVIAQFLLIATLVVIRQIRYSLNMDLGYKKEAIVNFYVPGRNSHEEDHRRFALLNRLKEIPGIQAISLAGSPPASGGTAMTSMKVFNGKRVVEAMVEVKQADTNYFNLYGMKLLAGRNLQQSDTLKEYVINETYARILGFQHPSDAVGHFVDRNWKVPIVGVLADFHTKSTRSKIGPLAYSCEAGKSFTFHLALSSQKGDTDRWKRTLEEAGLSYKSIYPEADFEPVFFDDTVAAFYKKDQDVAHLLAWSAGLTIFIGCLGLLGLVIYTTNARTKEIGVRKILGATVPQLVTLLSKDLLFLVLFAFILATPIAWWTMHRWLEGFAYRTPLSWWIFALTGGIMGLLALLTLTLRTWRSAQSNPVDSLRSE